MKSYRYGAYITMDAEIRKCTEQDVDEIVGIGIETYYGTFKDMCSDTVMREYLRAAFSREKILSEIRNPCSSFYFAYSGGAVAGYVKLNVNGAQTDLTTENGLEIERIYVLDSYKGNGIGGKLLGIGVQEAKRHNRDFVWLGVWEKNANAIEFYKKNGFSILGTHVFRMSDEEQTDYIMKLNVGENGNGSDKPDPMSAV